ncbi:MAG: 2-oxoglutarate dehydrogenase E1 component [Planctomycetes bacterium]|nr:2-oxoglutarate dehydrogenase E1 component [Planctomycetota bacterium]
MSQAPQRPEALTDSQNLPFAEELYASYRKDPGSVGPDWRRAFQALENGRTGGPMEPMEPVRLGPAFRPRSLFDGAGGGPSRGESGAEAGEAAASSALMTKVEALARAWRERGHTLAAIDPLGRPRWPQPDLSTRAFEIADHDLDRPLACCSVPEARTAREAHARLAATYGGSVGAQIAHIEDPIVRHWLAQRMESTHNRSELSRDEEWAALTQLVDGALFEDFVQRKFLGAKRFSLEGSEGLLVLLGAAIECAGERGIAEIVLAMAHRGRLNVLTNVLQKPARQIFREFEDAEPERYIGGRGDVKYHLGHSSERPTRSGRSVHLALCFNPSHLEFVAPVALGRLRAKQDRAGNLGERLGLCILIHGDAAFIGEGVTQETLNLSGLPGYTTGGTLHVVVNNQVGFTTPPEQGRTSRYCTDVARMLDVPIFHVNGEDPSAIVGVTRLCAEFRARFGRDAVIDLVGYRRRGHNEGDEPSFTDPLLYARVAEKPPAHGIHAASLIARGLATQSEVDRLLAERQAHLEAELAVARGGAYKLPADTLSGVWAPYLGDAPSGAAEVETAVTEARARDLLAALCRLPEGFEAHPKLARFLEGRAEMARGERPLDWSAGEALAYASLAAEGVPVRISGQDSERGTFSHRHAVLHDPRDGRRHPTLSHVSAGQARVEIHNSPLSEIGVLGFEYGYTLDAPECLVVWEAQFGDFANTAQVIIDQFLVSAEDKWYRHSGLVLLLPHGFEGQGPEHSSARLERFLNLAVDDNIQVVNVTTPANFFHVLRRQVLRRWRKPLIVMSPKSLLRHPLCVSPLSEFTAGRFLSVIPDAVVKAGDVTRLLVASGKLYYELSERRQKEGRTDVAILRLEELYPFPEEALQAALRGVPAEVPIVWVQEEPENMGAWPYLQSHFGQGLCGRPLFGIARPRAASPASGSSSAHKIEQDAVLTRAFAR